MVRNLIIMLLAVFCHSSVFAFQYGDYAWGRSSNDMRSLLKKKHSVITSSEIEHTISYEDTLFDSPCEVTLYFTEKSDVLYMVKFLWKSTSAAEVVFDALVNNHGEPLQPDPDIDRYAWTDEENQDNIAFDCSNGVVELYYSAGDIYKAAKPDEKTKIDKF